MEKNKFKNIVVFTAAGIGDFIWATSAISLIKQFDKNINITLIMCEDYISLVDKKLQIDKIVTLKRKYHSVETSPILRHIYKILWAIKNFINFYKKDVCIMLDDSKFFLLSAEKIFNISKTVNLKLRNLHTMIKYQLITRSILPTYNLAVPVLPDTDFLEKQIKQKFLQNTRKYKIALCTKSTMKFRDWDIKYFDELIKKINENYDTTFYIVGNSKEEIQNSEFLINNNKSVDIRSLCGKTSLLEIKEFLSNMNFVVSVDTSIVHLAAVSNIPTIAFYGVSLPTKSGGINPNFIAMFSNEKCSPCDERYYANTLSCEYAKCLYNITPDMVFNKIKEILI
jgi:ADP-heptose:LPS heptosyltransferase